MASSQLLSTDHPNNAITLQNQKQSPLLRLPGELRNKIYGYFFSDYDIHMECEGFSFVGGSEFPHLRGNQLVAMSAVCRQLHDETALLPFRLCKVNIAGCEKSMGVADLIWNKQLAEIREMITGCCSGCKYINEPYSDGFLGILECCSRLEKISLLYDALDDCPQGNSYCLRCLPSRSVSLARMTQIRRTVGAQVQVELLTLLYQPESE
ncbi:hypothetical protein E8E13_009730 [Curvularia kusanoi]|uniref:Uncharacterized protein n=1 Tax=Curvularia kusanoi TaxID=90978 RepID=A0A9P4TE14_CURKU|nr:hypothetical protein E8E13_009730 [Curvularia kusanoi]